MLRTCTTEGPDPSIVTGKLTLSDGARGAVCVIRPDMTTGQIASATGMFDFPSGPQLKALQVFFDGNKLVMHHGKSTLVVTYPEVAGARIPFRATFMLYGTRYRKNSGPCVFSLTPDSVVLDSEEWGSNIHCSAERPVVDYGEILETAYELQVPYKHLRSLVKSEGNIIIVFKPNGFGIYSEKHEAISLPGNGEIRYHVNSENPRVIYITKKDVLNHLTRAGARGSEPVFIGVSKLPANRSGSLMLNRMIGRSTPDFWSRTSLGPVDVARYQIMLVDATVLRAPPELFAVTENAQRYTPNYGDLKAADWTIPVEEEEMTEDEKKTMRAWWHAYIAQKTRLGEEIPAEHQEVADRFLS